MADRLACNQEIIATDRFASLHQPQANFGGDAGVFILKGQNFDAGKKRKKLFRICVGLLALGNPEPKLKQSDRRYGWTCFCPARADETFAYLRRPSIDDGNAGVGVEKEAQSKP